MYSFDCNVRYSEVGEDGKLKISSIINYMQDCSIFQSEGLGAGVEVLKMRKRAWLLSGWKIVVYDRPKLGDHISVRTWPTEFKAFMGYRNFEICSMEGVPYVQAESLWAYIDTEAGKPVKPTDEEKAVYIVEDKLDLGEFERKVKLPSCMKDEEPVAIRKAQIDTNSHVNNCEYVSMAAEYLPDEFEVKEIHVEYKIPTYFGMNVYPKTAADDEGYYVAFYDGQGKLCTALRFKG